MKLMMIMNLDYYFIQHIAASIISHDMSIVLFFSSGGDSMEKEERNPYTYAHTHHSPLIKKHFGVFYYLSVLFLFCFCFGILLPLLLLDSAGHFVLLFQFRFVMLCLLLLFVAFIGYPGVKIQDVPNKDQDP